MSKESALASAIATPPPPAPPTPEAPVETTTTVGSPGLQETKAPETLESSRFNQLAKKESEIVKQREQLKKDREAYEAEKEKLRDVNEKLKRFEELKVKDPIAALKEAGFTETDLYNFLSAAEDKSTPAEQAAKAAQAEIKKFQDAEAKKVSEAQAAQNKQVIEKFKTDITKTVGADKDKYEYCNFYGAVAEELIYDTVERVLKDSGELISVEEAAQMVETYYEEGDKAMMTAVKKRQAKEAAQAEEKKDEPLKAEVVPGQPNKPSTKTLTNKLAATVTSTIPKSETRDEKKARLADKLRNLGK